MSKAAALASLLNRPLAIEPGALEAYVQTLRAPGPVPKAARPARRTAVDEDSPVGVLPIVGAITYRPDFFSVFFGGTSIVELRELLHQLTTSKRVETIVMVTDSPGGSVDGLEEFAHELRAARKTKPVVAIVDTLCASAAYYLASQANSIVLVPSSQIGSVGTVLLHVDQSRMLDNVGITPTIITSSKYKAEGNDLMPLSDEARRHLQQMIDSYDARFVADIVRGRERSLTEARVRRDFGEGRVIYDPKDAIRRGMADQLAATPAAAFAYAANYGDMRRARVTDLAIVECGDDRDYHEARRRIEAQIQAGDLDLEREWMTATLRRAERTQ